jgi:uncharacterized membrane protein YbhN (UPF0104 family)
LRALAALALLGLAAFVVGWQRLQSTLTQVRPDWLVLALAAAALAQVVSVWRWTQIARIFGLVVHLPTLARAYAQGMTLNAILPGATLGGDALRSIRLQGLGNPIGLAALTVVLDRLSGLWVLCVLSLCTGIGVSLLWWSGVPTMGSKDLAVALARINPDWATHGGSILMAYLAGLATLCALPWWPLGDPSPASPGGVAKRVLHLLQRWHHLAHAQRAPLGRSLASSFLVQGLCAVSLWACSTALGGQLAYWQIQAVAAPVFIAGAIPLSYGGFGARELTALMVFPLVGANPDLGVAASALYGLVGMALGLLTAPSFVLTTRDPPRPPLTSS